jgi:RNA polymerase sigma factor (sigma-70 family)
MSAPEPAEAKGDPRVSQNADLWQKLQDTARSGDERAMQELAEELCQAWRQRFDSLLTAWTARAAPLSMVREDLRRAIADTGPKAIRELARKDKNADDLRDAVVSRVDRAIGDALVERAYQQFASARVAGRDPEAQEWKERLWELLKPEPRVDYLVKRFRSSAERAGQSDDDLVLEAHLKYHLVIDRFDPCRDVKLWTWLEPVLTRHFIDLLRREKRQRGAQDTDGDEDDGLPPVEAEGPDASADEARGEDTTDDEAEGDEQRSGELSEDSLNEETLADQNQGTADTAADEAFADELRCRVNETVDALLPDDPKRDQKLLAFKLHHFEGRSYPEIARTRGVSVGTAHNWVREVEHAFRAEFQERHPEHL